MSATHGEGVYGDAAGVTTPLDHKMAQAGQVVKTAANTIRAGLFWDGSATIVSGKANMSYDVRALTCVTSRGATAGAVFLSNAAVYNVVTTAAPGSNSRYDVVYIWQREFSLDGTDSNPVIGVVQGTAAPSPTVPSLAAFPGAIELARILVPTGVTATNSGTTITQTAPFTAMAGGVIPFRTTTERDAGTYVESQFGWLLDSKKLQKYNGTAWLSTQASETLIPTVANTGGSASVAADGLISFSGAISFLRWNVDATLLATFSRVHLIIDTEATVTNLSTIQLYSGATVATAGSNYGAAGTISSNGTNTAINTALTTSWNDVLGGQRKFHRMRYEIAKLAVASETAMHARGSAYDTDQAAANLAAIVGVHQGHILDIAYDGMGHSFTYGGGGSMTAGTIRIIGEI